MPSRSFVRHGERWSTSNFIEQWGWGEYRDGRRRHRHGKSRHGRNSQLGTDGTSQLGGAASSNLGGSGSGGNNSTAAGGTNTLESASPSGGSTPIVLTDFPMRRKLTLPGAVPSGLTDFPVLVSLPAGTISAQEGGANGEVVRFADAQGVALEYEIEAWDPPGVSTG